MGIQNVCLTDDDEEKNEDQEGEGAPLNKSSFVIRAEVKGP